MPTEAPVDMINAAIKYNPHLWGPDELRAIFVVRQNELAQILNAVRANGSGEVPQHILITGHRGMGKSTLLQRLALAITEEPGLDTNWLPLIFPEEQYTVRTLAEFWRNVLDALADALERRGAAPSELAALDAEVRRLGALPTAEAETAALTVVDRWVAEHQRGLVLLVDSSDLLFNALAQGEGKSATKTDTALWRLRKTLSHHAGLFWIGTSYQTLESHHDYRDAFHDFFALHELRPLTVTEMRTALLALARQFGAGRGLRGEAAEAEMARILDTRPERLQALRLLSGGNPRTTVTLYELFAAGGDDSIRADLNRLLDIMTPLYKARMEALSEQPQKILAHLMEHWHPLGVKELSKDAGIAGTTVSGQLTRLENEGLIEKARLPGTVKRSGYQASERFFNVWYLMRYGTRRVRQRLAWAVEFMRLWFNRSELADLAGSRARRHACGELADGGNLEFSRAIAATLGEGDLSAMTLEWSVLSTAHRESQRHRKAIRELLPSSLFDLEGADAEFKSPADYLTRFAALDAKLEACPHAKGKDKADWIAGIKRSTWLSLEEKELIAERFSSADAPKDEFKELLALLTEEAPKPSDAGYATAMLILDAVSRGDFFPDCPNSKIAYAQLESCFAQHPEAYLQALLLFSERQQDQCVVDAYHRAIELDEKDGRPWNDLGNLLTIHLKRYDEAEAAYRKAIELDERLALPWNNLGNLLQRFLKRYDEAEAAYRKAIELDEKLALPWNNLGNLLQYQLKRYDEAESAYRKAIELDEKLALPWNNLGNLLQYQLKRYDEAESAYRKAIELDEEDSAPWANLGNLLLIHCKRYNEAEAAYREAIELDETAPILWINLGNLLQDHLKRYDEAEAAYRKAIELDGNDPYSRSNLARLQAQHEQHEQATTNFRLALTHAAPDDDHLRLQAHLWLGNRDAALQALDAMAGQAADGDTNAFYRLREQCWECDEIGLGQALADLMQASSLADFLQPFSLALLAATSGEAPVGAAPEFLSLASEVLEEIRARRARQ